MSSVNRHFTAFFPLFPAAGASELSAPGWISSAGKTDPQISDNIRNVTVTAGREAILSCVVDNLGDYGVSMGLWGE